jgi:nuclear transport factor 2 (NTF2) superfamily protein
MSSTQGRPPFPPFTAETAQIKVKAAEDAWNTREPGRVAAAYTDDSEWRNRDEFIRGRAEIQRFLERKWARELDYRLRKALWEFADTGLMRRREASINDVAIRADERRFASPTWLTDEFPLR